MHGRIGLGALFGDYLNKKDRKGGAFWDPITGAWNLVSDYEGNIAAESQYATVPESPSWI